MNRWLLVLMVDRILEQAFHKRVVVSHNLELKFQSTTGIAALLVERLSLMMVDIRVVHKYYVHFPIHWMEGMDLMVANL